MRKLLLGLLFALASFPAFGQQGSTVVSTCGTLGQNYAVGSNRPTTQDPTGLGCVAASVSASITGFAPATYGTPLSVTTTSSTGALPAGAVVVVNNAGTSSTAYCALGATATVASQPIPPGGWFAYTVGGATQLSCITSTSTTTVNTTGGAGIPTGAGGGGSAGGGGGSVTQGTTPWIIAGGGTAGTGATGVVTVQGITNMSPINVNPHTASTWGVGAIGSTIPTNAPIQGISVGGANRPQTGGALGSTFATHVALVDASGNQIASFEPGGSPSNNLAGLIITAMTGTTSTALAGMGAQGGSLRVYVTACTFSNMSTTVPTEIILTDGNSGTTLWTAPAAINGGGAHVTLPNPIRTSANTALFAANLTTGASTKVSCTGYKAL